ncbi:hypothetical protein, partial [Treponema succinifaciens]|uniref:hypothetical protein n=1 Tax=Treponema succinifaciens TaxID=167 RepID=UPI0023F3B8EE
MSIKKTVKYKLKNIEFIFHYPHNSKRQDVNKGAGNRGGGTPGLLLHPARKKKGAVQKEMGSPNYFKFTR